MQVCSMTKQKSNIKLCPTHFKINHICFIKSLSLTGNSLEVDEQIKAGDDEIIFASPES